MPPPTHPTNTALNPSQATGHTESSDDRASNGAQAITVEDSDEEEDSSHKGSDKEASTEEDDDTELGACSMLHYWALY